MSANSAFNDEKGGSSSVGEPEYGHDPASGGIFSSDYKRYGATCLGAARRRFYLSYCGGIPVQLWRRRCSVDVVSCLLRCVESAC